MLTLRFLFSLQGRVQRGQYIACGVLLMVLKYTIDMAIVYFATGRWLDPLAFLSPLLDTRVDPSSLPDGVLLVLGVVALPFLWVGVALSVRRADDASANPLLGLAFAFPMVNYGLIAYLSFRGTRSAQKPAPVSYAQSQSAARSAVVGVACGTGIGLFGALLNVLLLEQYGLVLFFATPFAMGAASSYLHNHPVPRSDRATLGVALLSVLLCGGALLMFALEGVVCVAMALPVAAFAAGIGALMARRAVEGRKPRRRGWSMVLMLPLAAGAEQVTGLPPPEWVVRTDVVVDAPAHAVWQEVIAFVPLPQPTEWFFRAGIAYPTRATLEGEGVGAIRRCEFSTGTFVEPITHWDAPRRLAFDVTSQPEPLRELSPYSRVFAPHLSGHQFRSRRGEFLLTELPSGQTRLTGSTWYTLEIEPSGYWRLWTDSLVRRIHVRVLEHVKARAEEAKR